MSPAQTTRDHAVRMDAALADRSAQLALLATQCPGCKNTLGTFSSDAHVRSDALGGMWNPWPSGIPVGAQTPPPLAEAPLTPSSIIGWSAASAVRDIFATTDSEHVPADDSVAISRVAAQRLASTMELAKAYGINVSEAAADAEALITRSDTVLGGEGSRDVGWEGLAQAARIVSLLAAAPSPQNRHEHENVDDSIATSFHDLDTALHHPSDTKSPNRDRKKSEPLTLNLKDSPDADEAVHSWDCIAQALPKSELIDRSTTSAEKKADQLMVRISAVLNQGAQDTREFRCILADSQRKNVERTLLEVDLSLMGSSSRFARLLGAQSFVTDFFGWDNNPVG